MFSIKLHNLVSYSKVVILNPEVVILNPEVVILNSKDTTHIFIIVFVILHCKAVLSYSRLVASSNPRLRIIYLKAALYLNVSVPPA